MFFNGVNCDLYIGKGAGKKLLDDIRNVRSSVKIISPYLSPNLIKKLIKLRERNIEVKLITSDNIEDFYGSYDRNIHKLIIQNREVDKEAVRLREKWKDLSKILLYILVGLFMTLLGIIYFFRDPKMVLGVIPLIVLFLVYKLYKTKIKNKKIYNYWYSQLFPFKVYLSPDKNKMSDTFIHGKVYLIDNKIAYLGSLNFTSSGTKYNYETRVRTVDKRAVLKIKNEIDYLFDHSHLPEIDIQTWGKKLYREPIN